MSNKTKIAITTGDSAGIGPEIAIKAALDPAVRAACNPVLVSDPDLLIRHALQLRQAVPAYARQADPRLGEKGARLRKLGELLPEISARPSGGRRRYSRHRPAGICHR